MKFDLRNEMADNIREKIAKGLVDVGLDGALSIRHSPALRFVLLAPERTTRSVLIWKKSHRFNLATALFLQMIRRMWDEPVEAQGDTAHGISKKRQEPGHGMRHTWVLAGLPDKPAKLSDSLHSMKC